MTEQPSIIQLTEPQKACLRLVATGMSSKEIAKEVGLSPRTVDTYLTAAAQALGVSGRREASRRLAALEIEVSQNLQSQSPLIEPIAVSATTDEATPADATRPNRRLFGLVPPLGGERIELSASGKIVQIVKAAIVAAVAFGSIVTIGAWLQTLFA